MVSGFAIVLGKVVRALARLRGGGSALPGLLVERIDPGFVRRTLAQLPYGVAVVIGTNGKTTTTKIVTELLRSQGLTVFTNASGSNFTRGIASALLGEVSLRGALGAQIAVLELDEAHAVHFAEAVTPRYSLVLNVARDQLDRFAEIDDTARLLQAVVADTTRDVVLNRQDPLVASIAARIGQAEVRYFGLAAELIGVFPNDDQLHASPAPLPDAGLPDADVLLQSLRGQTARFLIEGEPVVATLTLPGIYNAYNAAAALALCRSIMGEAVDQPRLVAALCEVTPAFGRGERLDVNGQDLSLVLVKNPSGFQLCLASFTAEGHHTMIAINDQHSDGRDVSWLWDVDFASLRRAGVSVVSGARADDMALRLHYDQVPFSDVVPDLPSALRHFIATSAGQPMRIYCTYTAMLTLRRELRTLTTVEAVS